jgi:hypothetical protein
MGLLDKKNWDAEMQWYTNGTRIAWYDKHIRAWTSYLIDGEMTAYQRSEAQYYANRDQFEACEKLGHFDDDKTLLAYNIENEIY